MPDKYVICAITITVNIIIINNTTGCGKAFPTFSIKLRIPLLLSLFFSVLIKYSFLIWLTTTYHKKTVVTIYLRNLLFLSNIFITILEINNIFLILSVTI